MKQVKIDFSAVIDIDVDDDVTEEEIMKYFKQWWNIGNDEFLLYSEEEADVMPGLVRLTSVKVK